MHDDSSRFDAVVVGGGFYGSLIARYLRAERKLARVLLIEKETRLLSRASFNNQARVHNGYHYPRSFTTAYRSRVNLPRFLHDWPNAVKSNFTKLYAIARRNSKVTARQFERFCRDIGASFRRASEFEGTVFGRHLIEAVFETEEFAFDSTVLAAWALAELRQCNVEIHFDTRVTGIRQRAPLDYVVTMRTSDDERHCTSPLIFNCTYSGLNQLASLQTKAHLKHEITEMALLELPSTLAGLGITVMDGPFFSIMPFPARRLHTLSHVRYTPHMQWVDAFGVDPYAKLMDYAPVTRVDRMLRDVRRYIPSIMSARYVDSLFEVKTVLMKNETDDGRPIFFERHEGMPGCYSILGGKIDNIYDVLEKLDSERFTS